MSVILFVTLYIEIIVAGFVHMISSSMSHADLNIFRNDEFYGTPIIEQLKQRVNFFNYMTDFSLYRWSLD